jgi:hypothetical protein
LIIRSAYTIPCDKVNKEQETAMSGPLPDQVGLEWRRVSRAALSLRILSRAIAYGVVGGTLLGAVYMVVLTLIAAPLNDQPTQDAVVFGSAIIGGFFGGVAGLSVGVAAGLAIVSATPRQRPSPDSVPLYLRNVRAAATITTACVAALVLLVLTGGLSFASISGAALFLIGPTTIACCATYLLTPHTVRWYIGPPSSGGLTQAAKLAE